MSTELLISEEPIIDEYLQPLTYQFVMNKTMEFLSKFGIPNKNDIYHNPVQCCAFSYFKAFNKSPLNKYIRDKKLQRYRVIGKPDIYDMQRYRLSPVFWDEQIIGNKQLKRQLQQYYDIVLTKQTWREIESNYYRDLQTIAKRYRVKFNGDVFQALQHAGFDMDEYQQYLITSHEQIEKFIETHDHDLFYYDRLPPLSKQILIEIARKYKVRRWALHSNSFKQLYAFMRANNFDLDDYRYYLIDEM